MAARLCWLGGRVGGSRAVGLVPLADHNPAGLGRSGLPAAATLLAWGVGGVRGPAKSTRRVELVVIKDFPSLGFRGEEVSVRPGYARNYLIPQKMAVYATPDNRAKFLLEKSEEERVVQEKERRVFKLERRLEKTMLKIGERATPDGTLYGSVTAKTINAALKRIGVMLDDTQILLAAPIHRGRWSRRRRMRRPRPRRPRRRLPPTRPPTSRCSRLRSMPPRRLRCPRRRTRS
ncbi:ribosomal protein L9, N-terminal domain-containing protein, partial [Baffinella frigidus]